MNLQDLVAGQQLTGSPQPGLLKLNDVTAPAAAPPANETEDPAAVRAAAVRGAASAAFKTYAGFTQTLLEGLAKVGAVTPEMRDQFTSRAAAKMKELDEGDPKYEESKTAGEFLGDAMSMGLGAGGLSKVAGLVKGGSSFVGRLLTSTAVGAGSAATQFKDPDSDTTRLQDAEAGGIGGAVLGAAAEPLRAVGVKLMNAKVIKAFIQEAQNLTKQFDNNSAATAQSFQDGFQRLNNVRKRLYDTRDAIGDAATASGVNTTQTVQDLRDAAKGTINNKAKSVINKAILDLGPPKGLPTGLSPQAQAPVAKQLGVGVTNYSKISQVSQELDDEISIATRKGAGGRAKSLIAAKKAVDALKDKVENQSPQLKAAADEASSFYRDAYKPATHADFNDLKSANATTGFHAANKDAVDIATGEDSKRAKDLYTVLTPMGRRSIQQGIVARALDSATNPDSGVVNPKKLTDFFRDRANTKVFFPKREDQQILDGMANLTTEGSSTFQKFAKGGHFLTGGGMAVIGLGRAAFGHVEEGMVEALAGISAMTFMGRINAMMATQSGQNFLRAVSKVRPGSPAAARALNRLMAPAAGLAGGSAPAQDVTGAFTQ